MKYAIVAIRDSKATVFSHPMAYQSQGQALRSFGDEVNNPESQFYKHPEDYSLFSIGSYDDNTGFLIPNEEGPVVLANAATFAIRNDLADPRQLKLEAK